MNENDLQDHVAIITGGGTGIGKAIAIALSNAGGDVIICGRRHEPLSETVNQIIRADEGARVRGIPLDITSDKQVTDFVKSIVKNHGRIDILVNNAGLSGGGFIHEHDVNSWDEIMAVNLRGPFLMARAVLPFMRQERFGHILNISSESGIEYYPGNGAYGVAKHGLNALGEFIQRENQEFGIRVDTICPGMVVTPMSQGSAGLQEEKCLFPEDIADLALWLLSRRSNVKIGRPLLIQTMENPWQ